MIFLLIKNNAMYMGIDMHTRIKNELMKLEKGRSAILVRIDVKNRDLYMPVK
jgi:hypothetical protein